MASASSLSHTHFLGLTVELLSTFQQGEDRHTERDARMGSVEAKIALEGWYDV